jgi:hypothetical protein
VAGSDSRGASSGRVGRAPLWARPAPGLGVTAAAIRRGGPGQVSDHDQGGDGERAEQHADSAGPRRKSGSHASCTAPPLRAVPESTGRAQVLTLNVGDQPLRLEWLPDLSERTWNL